MSRYARVLGARRAGLAWDMFTTPLLIHLASLANAAPLVEVNDNFSVNNDPFAGLSRTYTGHSGPWAAGTTDGWQCDGSSPTTDTLEPAADFSGSSWGYGTAGYVDDFLTYTGREWRDVTVKSRIYIDEDDGFNYADTCGMIVRWQSPRDYYVFFTSNDDAPNTGSGSHRDASGIRLYRVRSGNAVEIGAIANTIPDLQWATMRVVVSGSTPVTIAYAVDANDDGSNDYTGTFTDSAADRITTGGRVGLYSYNARFECNFDWVTVTIDDKDTDLDTVPDARDNCVAVSNVAQTDLDGNRIGDACEDLDGDGYAPPQDCNDGNAAVHPGATELCDAIDQDCDGNLLEAFADFDVDNTPDCIDPDDDNDGDLDTSDCNDFDIAFSRFAVEQCDSVDNDCDGDLVDGFTNTDADAFPNCVDLDDDGDGSPDTVDCAPLDKAISPLALEVCDLIDQDCDGNLVESFLNTDGDLQPDCADADDDNDGYPDVGDCGPLVAAIHPGAVESACDDIDSNCDGSKSDGLDVDSDMDGLADCVDLDDDGDGSLDTADCAPLDKAVYPNALEICDLIDQDCDKNLIEGFANTDGDTQPDCVDVDDDGDGSLDTVDCKSLDNTIFPGAVEVCDTVDSNCNGDFVDGFPDFDLDTKADCVDLDDDNDGDPDVTDCNDTNKAIFTSAVEACDLIDSNCNSSLVDSFSDNDLDKTPDCVDPDDDNDTEADVTDCAPLNAGVSHLTKEVCNGIDDDCSGTVDDTYATGVLTWYADVDKDGVGDDTVSVVACAAPTGFINQGGDCNDGDKTVNPSADETCRPGDDDCDGGADDADPNGPPPDTTNWYADRDSDGYGDAKSAFDACIQPDGYTDLGSATDCDDKDSNVNPNALELCANGVDDNCDGTVDEAVERDWWPDVDGDGYGDAAAVPRTGCASPGAEYVTNGDDCDDSDPDVNPRIEEILGNGVDDDCDPTTSDTPDTDTAVTDTDSGVASDRPFDSDLVDTDVAPLIGEACGCRAAPAVSGVWVVGALLVAARRRANRRTMR